MDNINRLAGEVTRVLPSLSDAALADVTNVVLGVYAVAKDETEKRQEAKEKAAAMSKLRREYERLRKAIPAGFPHVEERIALFEKYQALGLDLSGRGYSYADMNAMLLGELNQIAADDIDDATPALAARFEAMGFPRRHAEEKVKARIKALAEEERKANIATGFRRLRARLDKTADDDLLGMVGSNSDWMRGIAPELYPDRIQDAQAVLLDEVNRRGL